MWVNSTMVNKYILIAELETLAILVGKLFDWTDYKIVRVRLFVV